MAAIRNNDGIARTFFGLAIAIMLGYVAYIGRGVLIPLIVAGFLCFLIFTLKDNIKKLPVVGKYLPDWFCYLLAFGLIGSGMMIFVEIIKSNVETLLETWPLYEERLRTLARDAIAFANSLDFLPDQFVGSFDQLQQAALDIVRPQLLRISSSLVSITSNALTFITVFLYLVFFAY